ncbi:MAG: hypothetical protein HC876_03365 [Chloroflexaceae bacterium]|nr:hypothetical protein [Chloroflexaceae bacterium]
MAVAHAAPPASTSSDGVALPAVAWLWRGAAVALIAAALLYPVTATPARLNDRYSADLPRTLNGAAFLENPAVRFGEQGTDFQLGPDYAAIQWLRTNIEGTPIIVEAHLPSYRWAGRVATYTGLPTLLGWEWHQIQQRNAANSGQVISNRREAIAQIFGNPDAQATLQLLQLYGIEYVYVGGVERALYSAESLAKFDQLTSEGQLERVYSGDNTTIYRVVNPGPPTVVTSDIPMVPPELDTPPPLLLDQPVNELPAVNGYAWNSWASSNSGAAFVVWLVALYALALLGLPLAVTLFGDWSAGLFWARLLGLIVLAYAIWLPTSYGAWHYDVWGIVGGVLLVLVLNGFLLYYLGRRAHAADAPLLTYAGYMQGGVAVIRQHLAAHWRPLLIAEAIFLAGLGYFTLVRMANPDLWHPVWGGEKPMEFGFLNAILRSPVMPPYDPFFSDGYINYYYYGFYLVSVPIKLTGIAPALAYNLAVATLFGLTLGGAYVLASHLTQRVQYGLLAALFVAVLGNLAGVINEGWSRGIAPVREIVAAGDWANLGPRLGDWYIGPSRIIDGTINEFPYFTFLFADLHPHMIALPITLLALALVYQIVMHYARPQTAAVAPRALYISVALVVGTLAVTNSWDYPPYALLTGAAFLGAAWRAPWQHGVPWVRLLRSVMLAAVVIIGGLVFYTPFFDHFYAMVSGLGQVREGTPPDGYLVQYGTFLVVVLPFVGGALWRVLRFQAKQARRTSGIDRVILLVNLLLTGGLVLVSLWLLTTAGVLLAETPLPIVGIWPAPVLQAWLAVLIVAGVVFYFQRRLAAATWFVLLLLSLAWCISLGIEYIYIRDHLVGGDFYRMNTVFKFGLQVWVLLALAAAVGLRVVLHGLGRMGRWSGIGAAPLQGALLGVLTVLVAAGLVYPLAGTPSRIANRFAQSPPPTLDGLAFMQVAEFDYPCDMSPGCEPNAGTRQINLLPDAEAIAWLNDNIEGTPIVVQSPLWFYRAYGIRIAANTGLPTVISGLHVDEQRDGTDARVRDADVDRLYRTTDIEEALRVLAEYRVNYIYVGAIENALYNAAALQKFQAMTDTYLDVVYNSPGAKIYQVRNIPSNYAQPAPYTFSESTRQPGTPPPDLLDGDVILNDGSAPPPPAAEPADDLATLEEQLANEPGNAQYAFGVALRYRERGRIEEAAEVLAVAAAANPDDVGLHHCGAIFWRRPDGLKRPRPLIGRGPKPSQMPTTGTSWAPNC